MKTGTTQKIKGLFLTAGLGLLSIAGIAQEHITLSLENITSTTNSLEYDLYVINDGSTPLKLSACAYGVNYSGVILNGAKPSESAYSFIPGTRSQALNGLNDYSVLNTNREHANQLRMTMKTARRAQAPVLLANVPYKVGRFKFTNASDWTSNSNPSITLNEFNVPGISTSIATGYVGSDINTTGFSTAKKNLTVKVVNSPLLNQTSVDPSAATLNGAIRVLSTNSVQSSSTKQGLDLTEGTTISLFPNPTQDILNVNVTSASMANTVVKVSDIRGRVVKQIQARSEKGLNTMTVSLREVPDGIYTVQVFQDNSLNFTDQITKKD